MNTRRSSPFAISALATAFLAFSLIGCGSVSTSIEGRAVTGKSILFSSLHSDGKAATITLDGQQVQVSASQISWGEHGTLPLPATWNHVELTKSINCINVNLDGREFGNIPAVQ